MRRAPATSRDRARLAEQQLGHTEVGKRQARLFVAVFLASLLCVSVLRVTGIGQGGVDPDPADPDPGEPSETHPREMNPDVGDSRQSGSLGSLVRAASASVTQLRDGRLVVANRQLRLAMEDFEDQLEEESALRRSLLPTVQGLLTGAGRVGNEQVLLGRQGWLFFRSGTDSLTGPPLLGQRAQAQAREDGRAYDPLPALRQLEQDLAGRGIQLWLLPVPSKAAILPHRLTSRTGDAAPLANASWQELSSRLAATDMRVVDPTPQLLELDARSYLRTDTHWSPEAVEAVAHRLARDLLQLHPSLTGSLELERNSARREGHGDLLPLLGLGSSHPLRQEGKLLGPEQVQTRPVRHAAGLPLDMDVAASARPEPGGSDLGAPGLGDSLAGDHQPRVLLLGDSFSNVFSQAGLGWGTHAGLAEQLAFHLQAPVQRLAVNDGGSLGVRLELARQLAAGKDLLRGKLVVIYQFAAREITTGDWQPVPLPTATPSAMEQPTEAWIRVRAEVVSAAAAPALEQTPYDSVLVALHLRQIRALESELPEQLQSGQAVAMTWGLRDRQRVEIPIAGSVGEYWLQPWSQVESRLGSLERRELSDPELLFLPVYWLQNQAPEAP